MCVSLPMKNEHLQHEKHEIDLTHTSVIVLTHIHKQHMKFQNALYYSSTHRFECV